MYDVAKQIRRDSDLSVEAAVSAAFNFVFAGDTPSATAPSFRSFTGEPLKLVAGHFGLDDGSGARSHQMSITSSNPQTRRSKDLDGAVMSFVEYLYELAK